MAGAAPVLGVSSFGAQGSNAHALVGGPSQPSEAGAVATGAGLPWRRSICWVIPHAQVLPAADPAAVLPSVHSPVQRPFSYCAFSMQLVCVHRPLTRHFLCVQVLLSTCMPRAFRDGGLRFATQLAAPSLARLWLPSRERHVLLLASAFVAAAGSAATMLHGESLRRRPALTGDLCHLTRANRVAAATLTLVMVQRSQERYFPVSYTKYGIWLDSKSCF